MKGVIICPSILFSVTKHKPQFDSYWQYSTYAGEFEVPLTT